MYCNQMFSLLQLTDADTATYTIQNIVVASDFEKANKIARAFYGADAIAVDTTLYPVMIGHTYSNGVFYNENTEIIEKNPTESERIAELETANTDLQATITAQAEEIALLNDTVLMLVMG